MAYRIDLAHDLDASVRRIAGEQLAAAVAVLFDQPGGPHEAIHDARKHIKRTRALYRLIAAGDKRFAATENVRLRTIATDLSHLRDAAALTETARYLETQLGKGELATIIGALRVALEGRRERVAGRKAGVNAHLESAAGDLRAAIDALDALSLRHGRRQMANCLRLGWEKTGKRARQALSACAKAGAVDEEPFHDLRKRTQDRWMQASLLRDIWPVAMISIQRSAKFLVEQLGHEHDLAVLDAYVATSDDAAVQDGRDVLHLAIAEQRHALQLASQALAKDLYAGDPDRDARILGRLIRG